MVAPQNRREVLPRLYGCNQLAILALKISILGHDALYSPCNALVHEVGDGAADVTHTRVDTLFLLVDFKVPPEIQKRPLLHTPD